MMSRDAGSWMPVATAPGPNQSKKTIH